MKIAALCDMANGDKAKIERLQKNDILKAGHVFTIADFTGGQEESDVEDLFPAAKYAQLLNAAYGLNGVNEMTLSRLENATPSTRRVVKRAEAAFRTLPADIAEFDHFTPSSWLIYNETSPPLLSSISTRLFHYHRSFTLFIGESNALSARTGRQSVTVAYTRIRKPRLAEKSIYVLYVLTGTELPVVICSWWATFTGADGQFDRNTQFTLLCKIAGRDDIRRQDVLTLQVG